MVVVGITKYPNITMTAINKGVVTVLNGQIHIGLRINSKRLLKRLLKHYNTNEKQVFMSIPINSRGSIFGVFEIVDFNGKKEFLLRLVED